MVYISTINITYYMYILWNPMELFELCVVSYNNHFLGILKTWSFSNFLDSV